MRGVRPNRLVCPVSSHTGPILTGATVSFHTTTDDKNWNTHLSVEVLTNDQPRQIAAHIDDDFGQFSDGSDHRLFPLLVNGSCFTRSIILGGRVRIRIDPNGNDTWRFDYNLTLTFSDGSSVPVPVQDVTLRE